MREPPRTPPQRHADGEHVQPRLLVDVVRESEETYGKRDINQILMESRTTRTPAQRYADSIMDAADNDTMYSWAVARIRKYIGDSAYAGANSDALDFAAAFADGPKVLHYAALDALAFHGVGR